MANYNFPMNYNPYQQPQPTGPIWVQGEAGAKSYLVAPNNTVTLWDSEAQVIYLKSADPSGMPTMKILDYTIRDAYTPQRTPLTDAAEEYATKGEMEAIRAELAHKIEELKESLGA